MLRRMLWISESVFLYAVSLDSKMAVIANREPPTCNYATREQQQATHLNKEATKKQLIATRKPLKNN